MAEYDEILAIVRNMVKVMEQSPRAFEKMGEEDLRTHFLVQLNGQYEGRATGETFNYQGKTDILIREEAKNVFIAECKFWGGEKHFLETIDQLLSYLAGYQGSGTRLQPQPELYRSASQDRGMRPPSTRISNASLRSWTSRVSDTYFTNPKIRTGK